jgi:hypothetical protein
VIAKVREHPHWYGTRYIIYGANGNAVGWCFKHQLDFQDLEESDGAA